MSEKKNDGGPAFPLLGLAAYETNEGTVSGMGMTLRDYFAGKAVTGIIHLGIESIKSGAKKELV